MKKEPNKNIAHLFAAISKTFAEAVVCSKPSLFENKNAFGREIRVYEANQFASLLGEAMSGIRVAALIYSFDLETISKTLTSFYKQKLPLTLVVYGNAYKNIKTLKNAGCIVLKANSAKTLQQTMLIGQVVSEKSLNPVAILADFEEAETANLYKNEDLIRWFGNPDDRSLSPTPEQQMVLGLERKRMPAWLHRDYPALWNADKNNELLGYELTARAVYSHIQPIIDETVKSFKGAFNDDWQAIEHFGADHGKYKLVATHFNTSDAISLTKQLAKEKVTLQVVNQLHPLPSLSTKDYRRVQFLEPVADSPKQGVIFNDVSTSVETAQLGYFNMIPSEKAILACAESLTSKEGSNLFYLNIKLSGNRSVFPKHGLLMQQINRSYPNAIKQQLITESKSAIQFNQTKLSAKVRQFENAGPPYSRINRFYDDTYSIIDLKSDELLADPFQAYPVTPVATAAFKNAINEVDSLPVFRPENCTNLEELLLSCRFGAIQTQPLTIQNWLDFGFEKAGKSGNPIVQLTPLKSKWVKAATKQVSFSESVKTLSDILLPAINEVLEKAKSDETKFHTLSQEASHVINEIGKYKVVIDPLLFNRLEKQESGTGLLVMLAVEPSMCTGCGDCERVENGGMKMQAQKMEQLTADFEEFEKIPLTQLAIDKIINTGFDPFAALQLNRANNAIYTTSTEELSQLQMVLKYYLSILQQSGVSTRNAELDKIKTIHGKLSEKVKSILSNSMPLNQMNSLMDVLHTHNEARVNMDEVFGEWSRNASFSPVDKASLERKLKLINELKQYDRLLQEGITGLGRPRAILLLDEELKELVQYPNNPFIMPAWRTDLNAALGVVQGQKRHHLDQVRFMRRATYEADDKYVPSRHEKELSELTWDKLTEQEKQTATQIVLVINQEINRTINGKELARLLEEDYPIRLLTIQNGVNKLDNLSADLIYQSYSKWPYLAQGKTLIAQGSLYDRNLLFKQMQASVNTKGSSWLTVLAPDTEYFDVLPNNWMQLTALAESTRAFLHYTFNPKSEANSMASNLELHTELIDDDFQYVSLNLDEGAVNYPLSWADWAYLQNDFNSQFNLVQKSEKAIFIDEYLDLAKDARKDKQACIARVTEDGSIAYYQMTDNLVKACEVIRAKVRAWREWAGLHTEFPEKLKNLVTTELDLIYSEKQADFEQKLIADKNEWENNYLMQLKDQIKETLLDMSGM